MGRLLGTLVLFLVCTLTVAARADKLQGARGPVAQKEHRVTVTLKVGHAKWVARRTFANSVPRVNQAVLDIDWPNTGEVLGLGVEGTPIALRLGDREGEVLAATGASERYHGGAGTDGTAALLEKWFPGYRLWVGPLRPGQAHTVEYEFLLPLGYRDGRYDLAVPPTDAVIVPRAEGGTLMVRGTPWPTGQPIRDAGRGVTLSLVPGSIDALRGGIAVIPVGDRFLTHLRIDAAPKLSQPPKNAHVVVVLDSSRSLRAEQAAGAVAAARAYLSHLPDARVEVVTFDRVATRRHGELVEQKKALADLAGLTLERRNGSELGAALDLARKIVTSAPTDVPRRIVVFTDGDVPQSLLPGDIDAAIDDDAARTHVVILDRFEDVSLRRENHSWSDAARKTGGLVWTAKASARPADSKAMMATFENLVRPMSIDDIAISSADWINPLAECLPSRIGEGEGVNAFLSLDQPLPWLEVRGEMWSGKVEATLPVLESESEVWSVFALGTGELDAAETESMAFRTHAVTMFTSLVAGHAAEAPPELLEWGAGASMGRGSAYGCCGLTQLPSDTGRRSWLSTELRRLLNECDDGLLRGTLRLEVVGSEIMAVDDVEVSNGSDTTARCLRDKAWDILIPDRFYEGGSTTYHFSVKPIFH